jgi:hypothetical protein
MARKQGILDWFRPPESKTLCPVWWDYVEKGDLPRMELYAALYGRRARVSVRGRWTLIGVGYRFRKATFRDYKEDPVILGSTGAAATVI